ncbi:MAG: PorT family protein [Bacteroidales bacterium]|jgi:hypothetical protein|nr:PorT family protein [Bacteroidales bacterium]
MKNFFLLLLLFSLSFHSFSQSRIKGGVRAGGTASQISGDDLSGFHKLGGYAGVFANIPLSQNENWKFQMELNFIMKGSNMYVSGLNNPNIGRKYTLNLFYLEVPFLFKFMPFRNFDIELGPTFNILFGYRESNEAGKIVGRPAFKFYEFSILGGISYTIKEKWGISLRYSNSIIPVRKPTWVYDRRVNNQFNSTFALSATYQF